MRAADAAFAAVIALAATGPPAEAGARDPVVELKEQARRAAERGDSQEALRRYEEVVRAAPRDIDARLRLAELHAWTHDLDHSIAAYRDILALDATNLRARMGLARVLRWSHRYAEAQRLYADILKAAPDDADAIEGLAQTYALAGDFPGSLALLERGLARAPQDADLLALKGMVLAWQGRFDAAIASTEKALQVNPRAAGIVRGLGDIYMWKRDFTQAAATYRRALDLDPASIETALDLAGAYEATGRTEEAEDAAKEALRRAPDDRKAMDLLQKLRRNRRWDLARAWRMALEAATHAGLPLILAYVFHRRRHLVRNRAQQYGVLSRAVLPALSAAWVLAFLVERATGDDLPLHLVEPFIFVSLGLAVSVRSWENGPTLTPQPGAVLAVGAHPDDIELGAGGLLRRLRREGTKVYGLVMSEGEKGASGTDRRADEARAAARVLGLHGLWVLDFPDTHLRDHIPAMREALEKKIAELGVGLVVTHGFREIHGDHVAVFEAAKEAARRCSLICFETVSTPPEFVPNWFVDITAFLPDKIKAVASHRSQGSKAYMDPEMLKGRAAHRGLQVGVTYAEAFWVYRWVG